MKRIKMVDITVMLTFGVAFLGLPMAMAINVDIPKDVFEFARGDNITLPCKFTTTQATPVVIITWTVETKDGKETTILTYFSFNKKLDIKKVYEGRVGLDHNIAQGNANLKLSNIQLADNKRFECKIQIPGDDEGKSSDTARLVVLVAPSPPICEIQGKAEYGQNINLTCVSEEGSPEPTYSWKGHDVRNMPRPNAPRTTDKNGILSLYNISMETSGYYICTSSNKIRSATCNVTLSVMPPSMNMGFTGGIIGGVLAALIVLSIIIYCCCCRKKKEDEEYAMGVPEGGEFHDKEPVEEVTEKENRDRPRDRNDRPSERSDYDYDRHSERPRDRNDRPSERSDYDYDRHSERPRDRRDHPSERSDSDYDRDDNRRNDRYSDRDDYRNERYDDRYDDRRDRYNDQYDEPYDDRYNSRNNYDDRDRPPSVPPNKPSRADYD